MAITILALQHQNATTILAAWPRIVLDHLDQAWITNVTWHGAAVYGANANLGGPAQVGAAPGWLANTRLATGHADFIAGFDAMRNLLPLVPPPAFPGGNRNLARWIKQTLWARGNLVHGVAAPAHAGPANALQLARFADGASAAKHYMLGYFHGSLERSLAAAIAPAPDYDNVREASSAMGNYNRAGGGMDHVPEIYLVGYAHARSGQPANAAMDPAFLAQGRAHAPTAIPAGAAGVAPALGLAPFRASVSNAAAHQPAQNAVDQLP
jgi:hypothetical protein